MSELGNVFQSNDEFWEHVKENPRMVGIPVSENKGLDLLSALADIREAYRQNVEIGDTMLTLLGTVLMGVVNGEAEQMVEEIIVLDAMEDLDKGLKKVLDEGR